ncbi:hypothetical protein M011DRAFT_77935 [Sporormia fimetaria CBS 119925]|uniref:Uncharacterized protein n=1 Tax=Sporormia fimetaria CBS 119925 TaxID=1340428 RepID=A0A6A6V9H7_9PLEO|nr:hypothetical protein M011DRAFT_77935 [Sporormia fimetaria CBS 119925]
MLCSMRNLKSLIILMQCQSPTALIVLKMMARNLVAALGRTDPTTPTRTPTQAVRWKAPEWTRCSVLMFPPVRSLRTKELRSRLRRNTQQPLLYWKLERCSRLRRSNRRHRNRHGNQSRRMNTIPVTVKLMPTSTNEGLEAATLSLGSDVELFNNLATATNDAFYPDHDYFLSLEDCDTPPDDEVCLF